MNDIQANRRGNLAGYVQTVSGLIRPEDLGHTLMHEHLLIDASALEPPPVDPNLLADYHAPFSASMLGKLAYSGQPNLDNSIIDDEGGAVEEVLLFAEVGGRTIVDVSNIGLGRNAAGLRRIAEKTALNIVMGCAWYVDAAHPPEVAEMTESELAERIVADLTEGVDGTEIRAGIIGEIGCSWPLTANEAKVLRAGAQAQRLTGAALTIHPGRDEAAPFEIISILKAAGADIDRTIIDHIDRTIFSREGMLALARTGCTLEWDLFGHEFSYYWPAPHISMPNDATRIEDIRYLIDLGYQRQIVLSHDVDSKMWLARNGGPGYAHLTRNILPRLRRLGVGEDAISDMMVNNPRNLLTFKSV